MYESSAIVVYVHNGQLTPANRAAAGTSQVTGPKWTGPMSLCWHVAMKATPLN